MKKSKSLAYQGKDNSLNHAIKRNPRVKYVKADVFRKHEKIREQLFEDKIWELVNQADSHEEDRNDSSYKDNNLNFQRTLMENSWGIHSLNDEAGDENDPENGEFVIAQDYGSFDECDNLDSQYSSMRGDSIPGEFDLEIVGSKLELPKVDALANIEEEPNKPVNASHLGSKITIGEPSGDVFGLTFDNNCNGIFWDDGNNEFLPINTLQTDN